VTLLDLFRMDGKVVVITGASSGLGRGFAHAFAEAAMMPDSSRAEMGRRARHSYVTEMSCRAGVDVVEAMLSDAAALRRRP